MIHQLHKTQNNLKRENHCRQDRSRRSIDSNTEDNNQHELPPSHHRPMSAGNLSIFRTKRIQSCRNLVGNNAKLYKRADLRTEVILRKEKLTSAKVNKIREAANKLKEDDLNQLKAIFQYGDVDNSGLITRSELHVLLKSLGMNLSDEELDEVLKFADADGSKAIDEEEWLMLVSLLIEPPYDENELITSFELLFEKDKDGLVDVGDFCNIMSEVLQISLSAAEFRQLPHFLNEMTNDFDPHKSGRIDPRQCIKLLLTPYTGKRNTIFEAIHDGLEHFHHD